jgi:hypothetical protein
VRSRVFFGDVRAIECRVIDRQGMSPDKGNLLLEEVLQRKNWLKVAPAFIIEYIKVGTERKD